MSIKALWAKYVGSPLRHALLTLPWFGPVVSAVLIALFVNILSQALFSWGGMILAWGFAGILGLLTLGFVLAYQGIQGKESSSREWRPTDIPQPAKYQGLVFMYSSEATFLKAVEHHHPSLRNCWLLATPEKQSDVESARDHLQRLGVHVDIRPINDLYDTAGCYETVRKVYALEARVCGLAPEHIISDITGGTKPMTMGMILACLEGGYAIEHVPTYYVDGKAQGPLPPIQIRLDREG